MFLRTKTPIYRTKPPTTAEEALIEGLAYYKPESISCPAYDPNCKYNGNIPDSQCKGISYFALSRLPICFARDFAYAEYNKAVDAGEPTNPSMAREQGKDYFWVPSIGRMCGHVGMRTMDGKCYVCKYESNKNRRKRAIAAGEKEYLPFTPCSNGHMAPRSTFSNACSACVIDGESPRQKALEAGETHYMPNTPCKNGHIALRGVNNGVCSQCEAERKKKNPPVVSIHKLMPDMIISREDAKIAGFKVYRTGKPCRRGHKGWRWVSTNNCLTCMGR